MPADNKIYRECRCTPCRKKPKGYSLLKYTAWRQHQIIEEALQARIAYQAKFRANADTTAPSNVRGQDIQQGEPRAQPLSPVPVEPEIREEGNAPVDGDGIVQEPFAHNILPDPELDMPPDPVNDPPPAPEPPYNPHQRLRTPSPPLPPPPLLEVEYDSDESESSYEFSHALTDPPALRFAYLNALADHIVRKHPVRDAEINLKNTLTALRLIPGGIPDHIKPLTTLKSVRRHLGLNTSGLLQQAPICDKCYMRYSMEDVLAAELPATCTRERPSCSGSYMKVKTRNGKSKKIPAKVLLYMKIIPSLRHMLLRPTFVRLLKEGSEARQRERPPDTYYDISDGTVWKSARIGLRRVFRRDGTVADEPVTPGGDIRVSSLGYGLFAALNIDWFRVSKKRSSGAIYLAILNLPRVARYHIHNVILACVITGPKEPHLEDLNFVLEPIVESFKRLYAGVAVHVYQENLPQTVERLYSYPTVLGADVPARSKFNEIPSHSHSEGPGCNCQNNTADLNNPQAKAYDPSDFVYVDEYYVLQLSKESTTSPGARTRIAKDYGIRWSAFNELPGWMPYGSAPFDPMHCLYLGIVSRLWCDVIEDGYLLNTQQKGLFESFLGGLVWPSQIGRLPSPTSSSLDRRKADEWRRLISVLPVALWISWRNCFDQIADTAPAVPPQASKKPTFTRDLKAIWDCVVYLTASIRLFTSWIAYMPDIERAEQYMQHYCEGLLQLLIRLQPNHHFAMHLRRYFEAFGPCYSWWLFPYERFNGILEQVELNYHADDIDTSLARWWIRMHQLHNYLERLPDNASPEERAVLEQLCQNFKDRGTLLTMAESLHGERPVIKPSTVPSTFIDLRSLDETGDIYLAVLGFARAKWPQRDLVSDLAFDQAGEVFRSRKSARRLHFVYRNTIRYGCESSHRSQSDQYALLLTAAGRWPVKIRWHFQIEIPGEAPETCTLVSRLNMDDVPLLPWSLYADDLGYYVTKDDSFYPIEAVSPDQLVSPVVTGQFEMRGSAERLRIIIAYDRTGSELFDITEMDGEA